jgi:hypothetical protein
MERTLHREFQIAKYPQKMDKNFENLIEQRNENSL